MSTTFRREKSILFKSFAAVVLLATASFAHAADRVALVVGNAAYSGSGALTNPVHDARAIAKTLDDLDFEVTEALDLDEKGLRTAIENYRDKLADGDNMGFFYFAGHAVQISGNNYLIPVDVDFTKAGDLLNKGYDIRELLDALSNLPETMNVIVLDSCRNNPFASMDTQQLSRGIEMYAKKATEDGGTTPTTVTTISQSNQAADQQTPNISRDPGLGRMDAPINTLIAYSTKPGFVALDGDDRNSPYTKALVEMMQQEGVHIAQVFADVRRVVYEETGGQQMPWESSSLTESFVFKERKRAYASPY